MFTILSWNIQQGGGSRVLAILSKVTVLKPTVVIFSEYHNNLTSGLNLRDGLLKLGYRHQFVTEASSEENSVLIASLMPCQNELFPQADPEFAHNIAAIHFTAFSIMGVYLPHKKKHNLINFMRDHIAQTDKPWIIAGDYNTGINGLDQVGDSFWYEDQLKSLNKVNLIDAFRYINGNVKEYSWYSHQGNGYRYDHTYIDEDLKSIVKDCKYLHDWRIEKCSDHSPMLLTLG